MNEEYEMTPAVKAQLANLGLPAATETAVAGMLENEYWRGVIEAT